ncbi:hypothetical protein HHI36_012616 [Cryptolaemus montrouzieri]|uniref:Uncharacterized protein n=1 Tax=Cryptolaemus montrouzieri TaxID=559131 RepID=A0ABD2NFV4_9CUCU
MPIIPDNGEKKEAHKPKCRICGKHCGCFIRYKEYFMPRKEPRYVKWMVSNAKWKEDLKYYNFHLKNVFDSKCEVDTRPPRLDIMYYLQANKIHRDDERIYEIEKKIRNCSRE